MAGAAARAELPLRGRLLEQLPPHAGGGAPADRRGLWATCTGADIVPYADQGPHHISNGLLLRSDFHKLVDAGLVTIEPDLKVRVSDRIRDHYFNGKAYYRLQGQTLAALPSEGRDHPDPGFLRWHNENRFVE